MRTMQLKPHTACPSCGEPTPRAGCLCERCAQVYRTAPPAAPQLATVRVLQTGRQANGAQAAAPTDPPPLLVVAPPLPLASPKKPSRIRRYIYPVVANLLLLLALGLYMGYQSWSAPAFIGTWTQESNEAIIKVTFNKDGSGLFASHPPGHALFTQQDHFNWRTEGPYLVLTLHSGPDVVQNDSIHSYLWSIPAGGQTLAMNTNGKTEVFIRSDIP